MRYRFTQAWICPDAKGKSVTFRPGDEIEDGVLTSFELENAKRQGVLVAIPAEPAVEFPDSAPAPRPRRPRPPEAQSGEPAQ